MVLVDFILVSMATFETTGAATTSTGLLAIVSFVAGTPFFL